MAEINESELDFQAPAISLPPTSPLLCAIDHYCRTGLYHHISSLCQQSGSSDVTSFWSAVALTFEGQNTEAIRQLEQIQNQSEYALAVTAAMINAHKNSNHKDKNMLENLKEKLKNLSKTSDDAALIFAGRYFMHTDKHKQSRQCLEKVYSKAPKKYVDVLIMLGWLNLTSGNQRYERKSVNFFDAALKLTFSKPDIGALLGRARYHELKNKYDKVLEDLNLIIVTYPDFSIAILEKARILMIQHNWEESLLQCQRILKHEPKNISALKLSTLYSLTHETKLTNILSRVTELTEAVEMNESRNHALFYQISQMVSRLANRNRLILQQSLILIEKACKLDKNNSYYLTEQGYQMLLLQEYSTANLCFQEASKLDEGNLLALHGLIKCKILQQNLKEAQQELEFLAEIQTSIGSNADLTFLHALLAWQKDGNQPKTMEYLFNTMQEHRKLLDNTPLGFDYYIIYNPDFIVEVIQLYMSFLGMTESLQSSDPPNLMLSECMQLLENLTQLIPGNLEMALLLSKTKFVAGQFEEAEKSLNTCLRLDPQCAPAHIIQAQIYLCRENFKQCSQSLEQARSLDFEIRNTPMYHLMKAKLLEASGQTDDALKVLQAAMELQGVKKYFAKAPVALQDRISIYMELVGVHMKLNQSSDAIKVMAEAKNEFKSTVEYQRIIIADADLAIKRREFEAASKLLQSVPQDSPYYIRAKIKLADLFLLYKKNKKLYAACYQELANKNNTVHSHILLGEAFMRIQEPEKAIRAYEHALQLTPDDPTLTSKIGKALITTHDYVKAVNYYESAAKNDPSKVYLLHELAELYLNLKNYDAAIRVLQSALSVGESKQAAGTYDDDLQTMFNDVKSYSILAEVYSGMGQTQHVADSWMRAFNLQIESLSKVRADQIDLKREQKEVAATICFQLAEHYKALNQFDKALQFYNESLKHNEGHERSRLSLAKLHLLNNDLDACQQQCVTLMRLEPNHKEASLMLADLMFRKNEHEAATYHFQQLLEKDPTRYDALSKLIQLLRRAGRLSESPRFLKLAEKFNVKATFASGLHYCKGLYAWYTNDPKTALSEFNQSRNDGEWGKQAVMNMIEIYINPDNVDLFQETAEAKGDNTEQVISAEKLIKDLYSLGENNLKVSVLEAYCLMASRNKTKIQKALDDLMQLCSSEMTRDYVPALLAMANAFVLLDQPAKARNQLKRISKMKYDPEFSQDFERSWLMLSDIYINVGKYEFAQDLCKKCLSINKSSAKSWEMLGQIMEKEQAYRDAAEHYEHAWNFMNQSSASIGFKLAFNYLKAKRYVEAIDVCHKVLALYPDYPRIKKEILAKAREALRP